MKKVFLLGLAFISIVSFAVSAEKTKEEIEKEGVEKAVYEAISDNVKSFGAEDLEKYMSTMHPESAVYEQTKLTSKTLFKQYDLTFNISSQKLVGFDEEYAYVRVVQVTKKVEGPKFRDNSIDILHVLKKDNGVWKLWTSTILKIEYL